MARDISSAPPPFPEALRSLQRAKVRTDVKLVESAPPTRIAPYAVAINGEVEAEGAEATGRFVVLHDPAGQEAWDGTFRIIGLVKAEVDAEVGADDMWADVAWARLSEVLDGVGHHACGGTVTKVVSRSYGDLSDREPGVSVELRVSWTPESADMEPHIVAWAELLASCAGVPPVPDGVTLLPGRTA